MYLGVLVFYSLYLCLVSSTSDIPTPTPQHHTYTHELEL